MKSTDKREIMDRFSEAMRDECASRRASPYAVGLKASRAASYSAPRWCAGETLPSITTFVEVVKALGWDRDKVWFLMTGEK